MKGIVVLAKEAGGQSIPAIGVSLQDHLFLLVPPGVKPALADIKHYLRPPDISVCKV